MRITDSSFYSFLQEYFPAPELVFMSKWSLPLFFNAFSNAATSTYLLVSTMACHEIGVESGPLGSGHCFHELAESNGKGL